MIDRLFDSTTIPLLAKMAAFTERRHEVLAGNIANASTPDYRTRDLPVTDFKAALAEAVAGRRTATTSGRGLWSFSTSDDKASSEKLFPNELFRSVEGPPRTLTFQDGNNRNIEQEVMEITKNSLMQGMAIELMNAQMSRLEAVISERA